VDIGHFDHSRPERVSTHPVALAPGTDSRPRPPSPDGNPAEVVVGSVHSSTQHVTLPGIVTVTRARTWRAPVWVVVLACGLPDLLALVVNLR
jgi:hypothetical protein